MTDPTTLRLDTIDLAVEFGWEVEVILRMDEFTKEQVTIQVQYSSDDAITSITRTRPNRAEEGFADDSPGKNDRLRAWLMGRAPAAAKSAVRPAQTRVDFSQRPGDWTRDEFIRAIEDERDGVFLLKLLELVDANSQFPSTGTHVGPHNRLWFGKRPGGFMFVYPFGRRHPPFKFSVKGGRLMISGCWNRFPQVKGHPGFADLAAMLDLDENGAETIVSVAGLDADKLWEVGENVSRAINA